MSKTIDEVIRDNPKAERLAFELLGEFLLYHQKKEMGMTTAEEDAKYEQIILNAKQQSRINSSDKQN